MISFDVVVEPLQIERILRGKDAKRFREAMENIVPLSKEEREEQRKAYELFKQRANFYLP